MSTDLVRAPIAIPPSLEKAGVTVVEQHGVRAVVIPDTVKATHNVVQPVDEIAQADPDWSPRLVVVDLSGDQYHYTEQRKEALTKNGILLLAHAAGIDVDVEMIPRAQLRDEEIGYKATASMRRSDGTISRWVASKVADVTTETTPVGRTHLPAKTESKAILRAVSLALQLQRGGYEKADLQKPFLIVGVSSTPSDPEVRRERVLAATGEAYGRRAIAAAPEPEYEPDGDRLPPSDVVDAVPPGAVPQNEEPDPDGEPVAGEIPDDVAKAGEVKYPEDYRAVGKKVSEVARIYLEHIATRVLPEGQEPDLATVASRVWLAWCQKQENAA